ncbi:hypothetical protein BZG36_03614 [Bifiguratus adelaidae]|uniref:Structural maintenance of chromosomes protein n=1 Tax=Bifiguratus adelaidae TaxID=1938954 RepID=A0A261Y010_9FUNG|nr:hypothetical protein BZG36_03614 [Bifiguratus adelaidae]
MPPVRSRKRKARVSSSSESDSSSEAIVSPTPMRQRPRASPPPSSDHENSQSPTPVAEPALESEGDAFNLPTAREQTPPMEDSLEEMPTTPTDEAFVDAQEQLDVSEEAPRTLAKVPAVTTPVEELNLIGGSYGVPVPVTPSFRRTRDRLSRRQSGLLEPSAVNSEETKPRMVIEKMVLINFKSYAGKQVIGPFHKSFSSVVGPNGSGKSNVIDALLFVFGYRANKMRQAKLSELIHRSAKFPNLEMCSVEVHFHDILDKPGEDAYEVIPNSQLVVSRQAYRNNSSKYQINQAMSTFTEVTKLLRERGIDLDHKRFLILQGEVESISLMKPKAKGDDDDGLLEYLEDIIGTSKYKTPIEEAAMQIETLNEERAERLNRVKYVEKEKQSLQARKEEAEDYVRNENELIRKRHQLYQIHIYECQKNIQIATNSVNELNRKLEKEMNKHGDIINEVKSLETQYAKVSKEYQKIEKETSATLKELEKFERSDVQFQEKKKHLINKQKKASKTLQAEKLSLSENQSWVENYDTEMGKRTQELKELEASMEKEESELASIQASLKGKTEVYMAQIEEKQKELAPWTEQINAKQSLYDVAKSEYNMLGDKNQNALKMVDEAEFEVQEVKRIGKEKEVEIRGLKQSIEDTKGEKVALEERLAELATVEQKLKQDLATVRQRVEDARSSAQASKSRSKIIDSLMKMRSSGRINGICGRLGSLGKIDDKYDVAVSTACRQLYDNIVVETVESGQSCIDYLRKNNLGRATFIVLNRLPSRDLSRIQTPENVPRLFDLITPKEERFAPAFYSVLQNTLVAENLQQANRIAYGRQRWRVVTLDGQLIDKSGTMSGGGNTVSRGAMSSKFENEGASPEILASLEREKEQAESEYRNFQSEKQSLEQQLNLAAKNLPQMEMRLSKENIEVKSLEKRFHDAKKRVQEVREQSKPDEKAQKRMDQLQRDMSRIQDEIDQLRAKTAGIEQTIKELKDKILEVGGVRLRSQKAIVDGIREQIDSLNERITKTQVSKAKALKDIAKSETAIEKSEREVQEIQAELDNLKAHNDSQEADATAIRKRADEAKKVMEDKKEELVEIKAELDEKSSVISKIRAVEVEIKNAVEDYKRDLIENQNKAAHWTEQMNTLSLQPLIDEDEEETAPELTEFTSDELEEMKDSKSNLQVEIAELEAIVQSAKPNLSVLEEYKRRQEEFLERAKDLEEITNKRDQLKRDYDDLRKRRLDEFMRGFNIISQKLKEMYQLITLGGNAELELVDSLDPFSEGIIFSVMPPKKSWRNISNLSGGEKTLSSLALVFALHHYKPTPLYVMDEIDAALDFRNVSIVANYIKDRTKNAQFIIISLRNNMFELADRLVGIYKTNDCTKSVAINPSKLVVAA